MYSGVCCRRYQEHPMVFYCMPFDCLTIPDEQEKAVMAPVETKTRQVPGFRFDDFVAGEGRGVNILLQYDPYSPSYLHLLT